VGAPSGLVTLLFTDIEGSTRAWENHPVEMQVALQRHDEIMRGRIEAADGYVFKTVGDAFCAAFPAPAPAVHAAVNIQHALAAEAWPPELPIRVRMGLHSGVCHERDGDYFGPTVNRAARLEATAYGGQVVISGVTADLMAGGLPPDVSLLDLGEHRLKDLGQPERVYQVCGDGLLCDFPPLRSLNSPDLIHNLPSQVSTFVGRDRELEDLRGLLEESRILTLTGAGGVGKTRLALQLAADLLDGSGDGVWFVDLAPLSDPGLVAAKTASVLEVREEPGRSVHESLVIALRTRRLLVVFDNCEHLVDEVARVVDELAKGCPQVVILSTSREPLRVTGEHVYRVPSLSVPMADEDDPDALLESEAVGLFLERAGDVGVVLDADNAAVVGRLCRRLDGIPLAIELAVARLRTLPVTELERRLDHRLRLLTGGSRTLPRQQTLEALIDWSYDLLSPLEQELLDRLSVFAGGFDLEAAEAVVRSRTQSSLGVLDRLGTLVDKSLVETNRMGALRYRLLESVRQYAAAKLLAQGEDVSRAVREAHRDYYLALAEAAAPHLIGHRQLEWLDRLERELDNLRTALTYCLEDADPRPGMRLNTAMTAFWLYRQPGAEGPSGGCAAVDRPAAQQPTVIRGRALVAAAHLLASLALEERGAATRAEEGLRIARAEGDEHLRGKALLVLAEVTVRRDDDRLLELTEEGLDVARLVGDEHLSAELLNARASSPSLTHHERVRMCEECLATFSRLGDRVMASRVLGNLAYLEIVAGEYQSARPRLNEAITVLRELDDARGLTVSMCNLGLSLFLDGMTADAQATFHEMLRISQRNGDLEMVAYGQLGLALVASRCGDSEAAAELHGAADAIHETLGTRVQGVESQARDSDIAALRVTLGDSRFEEAYRLGRTPRADATPAAA
jgi:predicted ATPase/class 3 adenylate cyclase